MSSDIRIVPLTRQPRDVHRFLMASYPIYRDDPHWVAPLLMDVKQVFSDKNPLFEHAEMSLWVATRDGRDVGRIAGILDQNHNLSQKDNAAFFGFFESIHDPEVSRRLFAAMFEWARTKGVQRILGPMNPTSNDECGLLVDGFDSSPVFMMTYNPRYYLDLIEAERFRKAKDLLAFHFDLGNSPLDRLGRIAAKSRRRYSNLTVRPIHRKRLFEDLVKVKEVYNEAWGDNWGFVPMTDPEINFMADRLKPLFMEGLVWLAESESEPVAFLLAMPDYNEGFKPLKGRLLTPKVLGFIPYAMGWKMPRRVRVITLGVKEAYRSHGLEAVMLYEGLKVGFNAGFKDCEASWVLEDNVKMRRLIELFGAHAYKTYRLYEREVG